MPLQILSVPKEKPAVVSDGHHENSPASKLTANTQNASGKKQLPQFVRDMLAGVPRHGDGVHAWLFKMARVLHPYRSPAEIRDTLRAAVYDCGRIVPEREIADAIANSEAVAWTPGESPASPLANPHQSAWPKRNKARRNAIISDAGGVGVYDLWEASPVRFEDKKAHTEEIIDAFFPDNPWLCCGKFAQDFATNRREQWSGRLSKQALIVPSPMTAQTGETKDGQKTSEHTLANTGARRFLVCEFDNGTADEQAALLLHLSQFLPLALAVHSGGKSLHGWFFVEGTAEDRLRRFMDYAVSIGADRVTWTRSQFVRMPDGKRDNGKRQRVYFFNPFAMKGGAQ